jgi:hypothetical protein
MRLQVKINATVSKNWLIQKIYLLIQQVLSLGVGCIGYKTFHG